MQLTTALLFASTALAAPFSLLRRIPEDYSWSVTDWEAGCARAGCYYWYNVSGVNYLGIPAFKASCSGSETPLAENAGTGGSEYKACDILETDGTAERIYVVSKFLPRRLPLDSTGPKNFSISVQYTEKKDEWPATFNYTGYANTTYNQFVAPKKNFTVIPTEAWAIA